MYRPDEKLLNDVYAKVIGKKNKGALSAVIFDEKDILYELHTGRYDKENGLKPDGDTLYMIGSNTKVMTVFGLFRLIEDGKLDLMDDIRKYIPEFSVKSRPGEEPMTVESFMMHRSGLVCDMYRYMTADGPHYTAIIDGLKDTYRTSVPYEMFSYSNLGYTLLGIVIERISGRSYEAFLNEVLFGPLGMKVYFAPEKQLPEEVSDHTAKSYDRNGMRVYDPLGTCIPAGACTYTSVHDLMKIGQLLMNRGTYLGKRLYREETIEQMKALPVRDELDRELAVIGHGLFHHKLFTDYVTGPFIGHGGSTVYHHSRFDFLPEEKLGIIIFTDYEEGISQIVGLEEALLNEYLRQAGYAQKKTVRKPVKTDITRLVGKYDTADTTVSFFLNNEGELQARMNGREYRTETLEGGWIRLKGRNVPSALRQRLLKQAVYFGKEVLIAESRGAQSVIGLRYEEPCINAAWLAACGRYDAYEPGTEDLYDGMDLKMLDEELVLDIKVLGEHLNYRLKILNDNEALVKGFGRNTGQTVTLERENGKLILECDGLKACRKERRKVK